MQKKFDLSSLWRFYEQFIDYKKPIKVFQLKDQSIHYNIGYDNILLFKAIKHLPEDIQKIIKELKYLKEIQIEK